MQFLSAYARAAGDLLGSAVDAAVDSADQISRVVQEEYTKSFADSDCELFRVRPELLVTEFPEGEKLQRLAAHVAAEHPQRAMIFDMSERSYDVADLEADVVEVSFRGLPAPPLQLFFELCVSAQRWLALDPLNVLIVHCFRNFSRSAVFLGCFLAFCGHFDHPADALFEVCYCLGIDEDTTIVPSQRRYLGYFHQILRGASPRLTKVRMTAASLHGIPVFEPGAEEDGGVALRPFIEVWCRGELAYSSLAQATAASTFPPSLTKDAPAAVFEMDIPMEEDVLLRVRHVYLNGSRDTVLRVAFHTSFVKDQLWLTKRDLDAACLDPRFGTDCDLEISFQPVEDKDHAAPAVENTMSSIFTSARDIADRLRAGQNERLEAAPSEAQLVEDAAADAGTVEGVEVVRTDEVELGACAATDGTMEPATARRIAGDDLSELQQALLMAAAPDDIAAPHAAIGDAQALDASAAVGAFAPAPAGAGSTDQALAATTSTDAAMLEELFAEFDAALDAASD